MASPPLRKAPTPESGQDAASSSDSHYAAPLPFLSYHHPTGGDRLEHTSLALDPAHPPSRTMRDWYRAWYLGLGARSAIALCSPFLVALVLVLVRVILSVSQLDGKVSDAKQEWAAGCNKAQQSIQHMRNWGYYAAPQANAQTQKLVEDTVHALSDVLMLSITALEAVLVYIVDSYRDTFLCFIVLLVQGTLSVITSALDLFNKSLTDVANGIRTALQDSVKGINDAVSGVVKVANDLLKIIHKSVKAPQIKVPSLDSLKNVTLPSSFTDGLHKINNSIPTMSQVDATLDATIRAPLNLLKADINATAGNYTFDHKLLPQPQFHTVDICAQWTPKVAGPLDKFSHDVVRALWFVVGALALSALIMALVFVAREWLSWRSLNKTISQLGLAASDAQATASSGHVLHYLGPETKEQSYHGGDTAAAFVAPTTRPKQGHKSPFDAHTSNSTDSGTSDTSLRSILRPLALTIEQPLPTRISLWLCRVGHVRQPSHKAAVGWYVALVTHPTLLLLLAIAALGMIAAGLQLAVVNAIVHHHQDSHTAGPWDMFDMHDMWTEANASMYNDSAKFANASNTLILRSQDELNGHLFSWANTSTATMNHTLNNITDVLSDIMNTTFSHTPLMGPMQNFLYCIIGKKIEGIEDALTWIHNHSHVEFPTVSPSVLTIGHGGQAGSSQNGTHATSAPMGSSGSGSGSSSHQTSGFSRLLEKIVSAYRKGLHMDLLVNGILLAIWALIILVALGWAIVGIAAGDKRKERKKARASHLGIAGATTPGTIPPAQSDAVHFSRLFSKAGFWTLPFWRERTSRTSHPSPDPSQENSIYAAAHGPISGPSTLRVRAESLLSRCLRRGTSGPSNTAVIAPGSESMVASSSSAGLLLSTSDASMYPTDGSRLLGSRSGVSSTPGAPNAPSDPDCRTAPSARTDDPNASASIRELSRPSTNAMFSPTVSPGRIVTLNRPRFEPPGAPPPPYRTTHSRPGPEVSRISPAMHLRSSGERARPSTGPHVTWASEPVRHPRDIPSRQCARPDAEDDPDAMREEAVVSLIQHGGYDLDSLGQEWRGWIQGFGEDLDHTPTGPGTTNSGTCTVPSSSTRSQNQHHPSPSGQVAHSVCPPHIVVSRSSDSLAATTPVSVGSYGIPLASEAGDATTDGTTTDGATYGASSAVSQAFQQQHQRTGSSAKPATPPSTPLSSTRQRFGFAAADHTEH